jgi:putative ATP-dependent endonuclease of OLD family
MLIDKIRVKNYRSCKDITIYPQDIMALVGPNNAGKTNILSALNFLLGERWPSRQGLALSDFYNQEERRPLAVEVGFRGNEGNIASMQFAEDPANGDLRARYTYFNNPKLYTLNNQIRETGALVYLDAARSFDSHFSASRWSMFGRIARELHDDFLQNAPDEVKQALTGHLRQAQEILKTERYHAFETAITAAFNDQCVVDRLWIKLARVFYRLKHFVRPSSAPHCCCRGVALSALTRLASMRRCRKPESIRPSRPVLR